MDRQTVMPKSARFWDRRAEKYSNQPVTDRDAYEKKLWKTKQLLSATDRALEIGCGTGSTAIRLAPCVARYLAIDYSTKMVEIAERRVAEAGISQLEFAVVAVNELSVDAEGYDVVLAHSILHLLPDVGGTLKRINEWLKPGGHLVSTTPCIGDFFPSFRAINSVGVALRLMPYVGVFGEQHLKQNMQEAGFAVEECWLPAPKAGLFVVARKIGLDTSV